MLLPSLPDKVAMSVLNRFGFQHRDGPSSKGQSLVEFALVLPMLLVLLLGLADFGRVFMSGITLEAAARNAAEAAAQEYVQLMRNKPAGSLGMADYEHLHEVALDAVCEEAEVLPNRTVDGVGECTMPLTAVCVHDGNDLAGCGSEADASVTSCSSVNGSWSDLNAGPAPSGSVPLPYVEVRTCYKFTTLFNVTDLQLPLGWGLSLGDIWLQRDREFTAACYQQATGACN